MERAPPPPPVGGLAPGAGEVLRRPAPDGPRDRSGGLADAACFALLAEALDAFLRRLGVADPDPPAGRPFATLDARMRRLARVAPGDPVALSARALARDATRLHLFLNLTHARTGRALATGEWVVVHVDHAAGRPLAIPPPLSVAFDAFAKRDAGRPPPVSTGTPLGL